MMTMADQPVGHVMVHHQEVTGEEEHQTVKRGHETATRISISDNRTAEVSEIRIRPGKSNSLGQEMGP